MSKAVEKKEVTRSSLWQAGGILVVLAIFVNLIVGFLAKAIAPISPAFLPLGTIRYTIFTGIGMVGGVIVYGVLANRSKTPVRTFQRIAWIFLAVSMIPDLLLLGVDMMPDTNVAAVITLMVMHFTVGIIAIYGLPRLT
ncbi:MAG: hypothetical protein GY943_00260 [Chloroflexi bacterium]|nr:hypothetical protein [Chloroflexota bacterium]